MRRSEVVVSREIRYGSGDFQNAVVSTCGEAQLGHGILHDLFALGVQYAVFADMARPHLCIGIYLFVIEPSELNTSRRHYPGANRFGRFGSARVGEFLVRN